MYTRPRTKSYVLKVMGRKVCWCVCESLIVCVHIQKGRVGEGRQGAGQRGEQRAW